MSGGCPGWTDPLPETPENLRLAVATIALKENADAAPDVTEDQARAVIEGASDFWTRACGISLVPIAHFEKDADALHVPYHATNDLEILELQRRFEDKHYVTVVFAAELRHTGQSKDDFVGGIGAYPWSARAAILMAAPSKNIFAHEFGHYLGLEHVADDPWVETSANDPWNLMFPGDYGDSVERTLLPVQCDEAKRYLLGYESLRPLCRPDSPDPELSKDNCPGVDL